MNKKEENENVEIKFDDINYSIYKIGFWKNEYKINLIGKSNEIPVTKPTVDHLLLSMEEIKKSSFEYNGEDINGILALSLQLDSKLKDTPIKELIAIEKEEYRNILDEINELNLENPKKSVKLDNNQYLIYKLEKDHHVTIAKPVNRFTESYHIKEIEKLKKSMI